MRTLLFRLLNALGLAACFRLINRRKVAVLMYHGVLADDDAAGEGDWLQVRESEFRAQMAYLKAHYAVVRLGDLLGAPKPYSGKPRAVLTFDDGYANNLHRALPILREFDLPATVFVATGHVGSRRLFWWDRLHLAAPPDEKLEAARVAAFKALPPAAIDAALADTLAQRGWRAPAAAPDSYRSLSVDELRALAGSGLVEIGSHTHGHEILERLPDEEVRATLRASCEALAGWGVDARLFAAPNGDYTPAQTALIAGQGFAACVATHPALWDWPAEPYRIPRFGIGRGTGRAEFALTISGALSRLRELRGECGERGNGRD